MLEAAILKVNAPEVVMHMVKLTGAGAANPTKNYGNGVVVTRTGTGLYKMTFGDPQGFLLGAWFQYAADTPAAGTGLIFTVDRNSATSTVVDFAVEDPGTEAAAPALVDLATTDSVYIMVAYKRSSL